MQNLTTNQAITSYTLTDRHIEQGLRSWQSRFPEMGHPAVKRKSLSFPFVAPMAPYKLSL